MVLTADGELLTTTGLRPGMWTYGAAYDISVDGIHTFFVHVADADVLVHNANWCGWTSDDRLNDHFDDHGKAMGFESPAEYGVAAQDFVARTGDDIVVRVDGSKTYKLDQATGELAIYSDGGIISYFVPDNPLEYFTDLPGGRLS